MKSIPFGFHRATQRTLPTRPNPPFLDYEKVFIRANDGKQVSIIAINDLGANFNSIDTTLASKLGLESGPAFEIIEGYTGQETTNTLYHAFIVY